MTGVRQYARLLHATEELVRVAFGEEACHGCSRPDLLAALQKQFQAIVSVAKRHFESLRQVIARWQEKVRRGEMEFSQAREALFLETLRAFVSLADTLSDTFDRIHRQEGVFLSKPRSVSVLVGQKTEAQKTLDSWQPPEWEVTGMRTVKWDKEQTRHLMDRLASCE